MNYHIRPATLNDLKELRELEKQLIEFERAFDSDISPDKEARYYDLPDKINHPDKSIIFVAESEESLIGCGMGTILPLEDWAAGTHYGMINMIYTTEECRGEGVASQILENLKQWFLNKDIQNIHLKVYSENLNAIKAYQKNNFEPFTMGMKLKL